MGLLYRAVGVFPLNAFVASIRDPTSLASAASTTTMVNTLLPSNGEDHNIFLSQFQLITLNCNFLLSSVDIDWQNPGEAIGTILFLAYIGVSLAAGLKYIVKDGWRPKL